MIKPSVVIVSPALADANNGNWQTARRWAYLLRDHYRVRIVKQWPDTPDSASADTMMLALHARRSADSILAWSTRYPRGTPGHALLLALTGTDLYRDIDNDAAAQQSLALADRLIVLQEQAPARVPLEYQHKTSVVFQSVTTRQPFPKTSTHLRAVMVGHLRVEKNPQTLFDAALMLADVSDILIDHIGQGLDAHLAQQAQRTAALSPQYRWLGGLNHEATRKRMGRAHLLVHTSLMEGGAHVIMEAICGGTPVLASRIDGNVGMLGPEYAGYFELHDARALSTLLQACRQDIRHGVPHGSLYHTLQQQCAARAPLFTPEAEQHKLLALLNNALQPSHSRT